MPDNSIIPGRNLLDRV